MQVLSTFDHASVAMAIVPYEDTFRLQSSYFGCVLSFLYALLLSCGSVLNRTVSSGFGDQRAAITLTPLDSLAMTVVRGLDLVTSCSSWRELALNIHDSSSNLLAC